MNVSKEELEVLIEKYKGIIPYIIMKNRFFETNDYEYDDLYNDLIIKMIILIHNFDINRSENLKWYLYTCLNNQIKTIYQKRKLQMNNLSLYDSIDNIVDESIDLITDNIIDTFDIDFQYTIKSIKNILWIDKYNIICRYFWIEWFKKESVKVLAKELWTWERNVYKKINIWLNKIKYNNL